MSHSNNSQQFEDYSTKEKLGIPTAFLLWGSGILYFGIMLNPAHNMLSYLFGAFFICTSIIGFMNILTEYYTNHYTSQHNHPVKK